MASGLRLCAAACAGLVIGLAGAHAEPGEFELEGARVDHVLVTLSSERYDALQVFLSEELGDGWMAVPPQHKGFIFGVHRTAYAEIWDAGGHMLGTVGDQVAIGTTNEDDGKPKAAAFYGHEGVDWGVYGATGLYTVGTEFYIGHPIGGTFVVTYGPMMSPPPEASPLERVSGVVTAMPAFRMVEAKTYRAFGFTEQEIEGGVEFTDPDGAFVRLLERPSGDVLSIGHVALRLTLRESVESSRRVTISPSMDAVFEGESLWLLLRPELFDPFEHVPAEADDAE